MNPSGFYVDPLFSYIDLLNYMLKYKIPQIVALTQIYPSGFYIDP